MNRIESKRPRWVTFLAPFAIFFGALTIVSGGLALFNATAQRLAGDYVAFVLWFNFLAGFAYIIAGIGLWTLQRWSRWLSAAIAVGSIIVFAAFGMQVLSGGSYEMRTVWAMTLRTTFWIVTSVLASK